jgi:hypothetical protein
MKRTRIALTLALLIVVGLAIGQGSLSAAASPGAAPRAAGYEISWYTVDGGGAMNVTGGTYSLSGTIGQYDAGRLSGGTYTLLGGFWVEFGGFRLYLPLIMKNFP